MCTLSKVSCLQMDKGGDGCCCWREWTVDMISTRKCTSIPSIKRTYNFVGMISIVVFCGPVCQVALIISDTNCKCCHMRGSCQELNMWCSLRSFWGRRVQRDPNL